MYNHFDSTCVESHFTQWTSNSILFSLCSKNSWQIHYLQICLYQSIHLYYLICDMAGWWMPLDAYTQFPRSEDRFPSTELTDTEMPGHILQWCQLCTLSGGNFSIAKILEDSNGGQLSVIARHTYICKWGCNPCLSSVHFITQVGYCPLWNLLTIQRDHQTMPIISYGRN